MQKYKHSTQKVVSKALKISEGHLSDVLSGKAPLSRKLSKKISVLAGIKWNLLLSYEVKDLRKVLGLNKNGRKG